MSWIVLIRQDFDQISKDSTMLLRWYFKISTSETLFRQFFTLVFIISYLAKPLTPNLIALSHYKRKNPLAGEKRRINILTSWNFFWHNTIFWGKSSNYYYYFFFKGKLKSFFPSGVVSLKNRGKNIHNSSKSCNPSWEHAPQKHSMSIWTLPNCCRRILQSFWSAINISSWNRR